MTLDSFDVVFFTIGFLVPGFVWSAVLAMLVPSRTAPVQIRLLEFLTLSCINYGLWSWLLFAVFKSGFVERHPVWSGWLLFLIIFASPVALGVASAWFRQRELVAGSSIRWDCERSIRFRGPGTGISVGRGRTGCW